MMQELTVLKGKRKMIKKMNLIWILSAVSTACAMNSHEISIDHQSDDISSIRAVQSSFGFKKRCIVSDNLEIDIIPDREKKFSRIYSKDRKSETISYFDVNHDKEFSKLFVHKDNYTNNIKLIFLTKKNNEELDLQNIYENLYSNYRDNFNNLILNDSNNSQYLFNKPKSTFLKSKVLFLKYKNSTTLMIEYDKLLFQNKNYQGVEKKYEILTLEEGDRTFKSLCNDTIELVSPK